MFLDKREPKTNIEKLNKFYIELSTLSALPEIDSTFFGGNYNESQLYANEKMAKLEKSFLDEAKSNPALFEIQLDNGLNAGMIACIYQLKTIATISLLYKNTLTQTTKNGETFADYMKKYTDWNLNVLKEHAKQIGEKDINKTLTDLHRDILEL